MAEATSVAALTLASVNEQWLLALGEERFLHSTPRRCDNCAHGTLHLALSDRYSDGWCMRCNSHDCGVRRSVRERSFFEEHPSVPLPPYLATIRLLQHQIHQDAIAEIVGTSVDTVSRIHSDLMVKIKRLQALNPTIFRDETVEIDCNWNAWKRLIETEHHVFGDLARFERGKMLFGIKGRQSKRVHIECVVGESAEECEAVIQCHVMRSCVIMHDAAGAYERLDELGYRHFEINKAQEGFARRSPVFKETIHVNNIEAVWREKAEWILSRHGQLQRQMEDFVVEFNFIQNKNRFLDAIQLIE